MPSFYWFRVVETHQLISMIANQSGGADQWIWLQKCLVREKTWSPSSLELLLDPWCICFTVGKYYRLRVEWLETDLPTKVLHIFLTVMIKWCISASSLPPSQIECNQPLLQSSRSPPTTLLLMTNISLWSEQHVMNSDVISVTWCL